MNVAKKNGIQIEIDNINVEIEQLVSLRNRLEAVMTQQRRKRVKKTVERGAQEAPRELASTR